MSLRIAARGKLKLGKKDSNVVGPCKNKTKSRKKMFALLPPQSFIQKMNI